MAAVSLFWNIIMAAMTSCAFASSIKHRRRSFSRKISTFRICYLMRMAKLWKKGQFVPKAWLRNAVEGRFLKVSFVFYKRKQYSSIITFSKLDSCSGPLFISLGLIKFFDIALFQIAVFMYKFHNNVLPAAFHSFFYQGNKCS